MVLWHAINLLREHRGDGHITALLAVGLDPCEALVSFAAIGAAPQEVFASRGWTAAEWSAPRDRLAARGWVDADGNATERGRDGRDEIEWRTDRLADAPWQALGPTRAQRLAELTGPLLGPAFGQRLAVPRQPGERQHGQLTLPSAILISRQCDPGWCCEAAGDLPVVCLAASVSLIQGGHEGRAGTRRSALSAAWFWPGQEGHNNGNS